MTQTFISKIEIGKVRHIKDITIDLDSNNRKHLILTGKNGSGKTSVLDALANHLRYIVSNRFQTKLHTEKNISDFKSRISEIANNPNEVSRIKDIKSVLSHQEEILSIWNIIAVHCDFIQLRDKYESGKFILAYYKANRNLSVEISNTIEKIDFKNVYSLDDTPGVKLVKYMVSLKATQAFANQEKNSKRFHEIEEWFIRFENILKNVFDDKDLKLEFDIENFTFTILQSGHEPFDFNLMSSGYSAVFKIINDLMMRSVNKGEDLEGVVLIDEIETHLHLELQKNILPILTGLYPKIQFVISTHSPFILSSAKNAIIYDLETKALVKTGLEEYAYESIVEGYFNVNKLSNDIKEKFERYKLLCEKQHFSDNDYAEMVELESILDEIPDFLAVDIAAEYSRLKLEVSNRGDCGDQN